MIENTKPFDFYEVVTISPMYPDSKMRNLEGAILGRSQDSNGSWGYAVHIFSKEECWDLEHEFLEKTGKKMSREDFYSGESVTVIVDAQSDEGKLED